MKEKIFENGFLKPNVFNPNYRGIIGWPCEVFKSGAGGSFWSGSNTIISIDSMDNMYDKEECVQLKRITKLVRSQDVRVKEFTPADIPVGELCWVKFYPESQWLARTKAEFDEVCNNGYAQVKIDETYCVPFILAETAEDAELMKDWWK